MVDGIENEKLAAWRNETPAVIVNIQRQPGANIIQVVDRIKALLPKLKTTIPAAINVATLTTGQSRFALRWKTSNLNCWFVSRW